MPKIFITGSGTTKYHTGSGVINNPARVVLRDRDNSLNTYPRIKQLGDNDASFTMSSFNDNNVILFGRKISDDFNMEASNPTQYKRKVDLNKWAVFAEDEIIIRKEDLSDNPSTVPTPPHPGALVLGGKERWIRTANKVKNPTLRFKVIFGDYGFQNVNALRLFKAVSPNNTLNVQISTSTSGPWQGVEIKERNISGRGVTINAGGLNPIYESTDFFNNNSEGVLKPECEVTLGPDQLNIGASTSFYVRITQQTISDINEPNWAISEIEIISRDETTIGQTGLKRSDTFALTSSFSSPNKLSNLTVQNSISLPHKSDNLFTLNEENPQISPFNDNRGIFGVSREFYQYGVDPLIYPGFDQILSNKSYIEVDLSPTSPTRLGYVKHLGDTDAGTGGDSSTTLDESEDGQQLMAYWNKDLNRWEKIGRPFNNNNTASPTGAKYLEFLSQSCLGFGGIPVHYQAPGSTTSDITASFVLPQSYYELSNKPITSCGFPFAGQYHATSSQYVKAKDIGITKPFLLEKCVLDVDVNINFPGTTKSIFPMVNFWGLATGAPNLNKILVSTVPNINVFSPTFFILRQYKDNFTKTIKVKTSPDSTSTDANNDLTYDITIPGQYHLQSGSSVSTYVDNSRELITYGQFQFWHYQETSQFNLKPLDFIEAGLNSDVAKPIIKNTPGERDAVATGEFNGMLIMSESITMEFPVRNTSPYNDRFIHQVYDNTIDSSNPTNPQRILSSALFGKREGGKSESQLKAPRSLFNGYSSYNLGKTIFMPHSQFPGGGVASYQSKAATPDTVDQISPHIIMPEDELIFGWQFPPSAYSLQRNPGANEPAKYKDHMELLNNSKLRLFGSEIKNNSEYHCSLNQDLTTNAIHSVIGDDPVTDQFQLSIAGELTGSFYDDFTYRSDGTAVVYGRNLSTHETNPNIIDPDAQQAWTVGSFVPENRLGQSVLSIIDLDNIFAQNPSLFTEEIKSFFGQIVKNSSAVDLNRVFNDASYKSRANSVHYNSEGATAAEYGSAQNIYANSDGSLATRLGGSPKYFFNKLHFGYYSDMHRQGLDSKFVDDPTTSEDNLFTESPVQVQFVAGRFNIARGVKEYEALRPAQINGTADEEFQSSNLSLNATSSIAFKDDNLTRNRTYGIFEISVTETTS